MATWIWIVIAVAAVVVLAAVVLGGRKAKQKRVQPVDSHPLEPYCESYIARSPGLTAGASCFKRQSRAESATPLPKLQAHGPLRGVDDD